MVPRRKELIVRFTYLLAGEESLIVATTRDFGVSLTNLQHLKSTAPPESTQSIANKISLVTTMTRRDRKSVENQHVRRVGFSALVDITPTLIWVAPLIFPILLDISQGCRVLRFSGLRAWQFRSILTSLWDPRTKTSVPFEYDAFRLLSFP